jgi:N-acetylmuramic acid 6-phosphate etherase
VNDSSRVPSTEAIDPATSGLDELDSAGVVGALVREQGAAVAAVEQAAPALALAVDAVAARLRAGGRLHYFGAGSSGRLAFLDAAECTPTFGTPPELVQAHIAGGREALVRAIEGAEDDAAAGRHEALAALEPRDVAVGISASGSARYVVAAMQAARGLGVLTLGVTSDERSALAGAVEMPIVVATGAEPLAGSTRLKAGTAQKLVLNALSTAVMVRLGKVYDNLMVDLIVTNEKLLARALRLVARLVPCDAEQARQLLDAAGGSVTVAVVMARRDCDAAAARALLARSPNGLRGAL